MLRKLLLFVVAVLFSQISLFAQSGTTIDFNSFNEKVLSQLIYEKINKVRDSLGLEQLRRDSILELAAGNHSRYLKKAEKTEHAQQDPSFATPELRVEHFNGTHDKIAENIDLLYIGKPFTIYKEKHSIKITTYEAAAYAFVKATINAHGNFAHLSSRNFYRQGVAFAADPAKKAIYITHLYGTIPYYFPASLSSKENKKIFYPSKKANIDNAYGIEQGTDKVCSKCIADFNKIPDHVEKTVIINDNKVYFSFGDLKLLTETFGESEISVSADIVSASQLPCGSGNSVHRSFAFDGILLKPVHIKDLIKHNLNTAENKLFVKLGDVPAELRNQDLEVNLLLIKENQLCRYIVDYPIVKTGVKLVKTELFVDTLLKSEITKNKSLRFSIPFEKDKAIYSEDDLKPFYDSLNLNRFNITEVTVLAYSSVEGSTERNTELQKSRAESIVKVLQSFQLDAIKTTIKAQENWDQFYRDIKNTGFSYLSSLNKDQIKEQLQIDTISSKLEPLLAKERKAVLFLKITEKIDLNNDKTSLITHYAKAIAKKDVSSATLMQTSIYEAISAKELGYELLKSVDIPGSAEFAQLKNNDIIFRYYQGFDFDYLGELNKASALDPSNLYIKYNIYALTLEKWNDSAYSLTSPEALLKNIKALYNTKIDKKLVNKLYINYQMLVSEYYYENSKYKNRDDAIGLVKKYYKATEEKTEDFINIATFFHHNNRSEWALEILFPIMQKGEYSEDLLFCFLSIAITRPELFEKKELEAYFLKAKDFDKNKFCKLFGEDKLFFQYMKQEQVKEYYCTSCAQ